MNIRKISFVFLAIVFCAAGASYAVQPSNNKPVEVNGDNVEYMPSEKKVVGKGNVSIKYGDVTLLCDKITVYTETRDANAEGHVVLKTPTGEVRGARVKYNFATKKGEVLKARVKSGEWYAGGDKVDIKDGLYEIKNGYVTSCDRDPPHYRISTRKVIIYPDDRVVAKDVFFKVGKVPVFYMPVYHHSLDTGWPAVNVIPGRKKKWGVFALTSYRYEFNKDNKVTLRLDERKKWGLGTGLDYSYAIDGLGHGILRTYYTDQRDVDRNEPQRAEEERYRVQLRHRWDINDATTAIVELHKMHDADFTKDYFYREEYDTEPSPETYLYILARDPEYGVSFLAKKRINRFQSVVERLPQVRFDLKDQKLPGLPLYFKTDTQFASLNEKAANSGTDSDAVRFDTYNKLTAPVRIADFISLSPFVGMRDTYYSKKADGDENELRSAFYTGIDASTKFFKTYDISGRFLGVKLNKLRHIITPTIEYEYIHEPSMTPGALQQIDDIDAIARKNAFTLGLENKFQTKREKDGELSSYDLGYLLLTGDYLYKPENGSRFSNVKADLEFTPYDWLRIESDALYDPDTRDFDNWNLDFYMDRGKDMRLGLGSRYWKDEEHELTGELFYKLNPQWSFRLFGRYDLKHVDPDGHKIINRFDNKEITIIKDLHCWVAEVSLESGRDGGLTVWFSMKLKASPKIPFDFSDYYARPKQSEK